VRSGGADVRLAQRNVASCCRQRCLGKRGGVWGAITRVWLVLTGQSRMLHDHLLACCLRSNDQVRGGLWRCPRDGLHCIHTGHSS